MAYRRRRLKNPGVTQALFATLMPYAVLGGVGFFVYQKYFAGAPAPDTTQGSASTDAGATVSALISNPGAETTVLGNDLSNTASGITGLVSSGIDSLENGVNSFFQNL